MSETQQTSTPDKQQTEAIIHKLLQYLCKIDDSEGKELLDFGGCKVDDKSWHVWNWPQGIGLFGVYQYYMLTHDKKARDIIESWFAANMKDGAPEKNINTMAPLLTLAYMYEDTHNSTYLPYLQQWGAWAMNRLTRTDEGGFQHVTYGPERRNQMWDDTLMMSVVTLAKIGQVLGDESYLEEAKYQFLIHTQYLRDKKTGLWFHGWNFEGHHNFGEAFWCRGNCWITIAIPLLLDILQLPETDAFVRHMSVALQTQVASLVQLQDGESGLWHTLLDDPTSYLETSGSAGIAYGILHACHRGLLDEKYRDNGLKAVEGLLHEIGEHGEVAQVSIGTECAQDKEYYKTVKISEMPYGQSLSILALAEYLVEFC